MSIETRETRPGTRVTMAAVIDAVHTRYSKTIAGLIQENAELTAAVDALTGEPDELASKVQALLAPAATPGQG